MTSKQGFQVIALPNRVRKRLETAPPLRACAKSRVLGVIASEAKQSFPIIIPGDCFGKNPRNDTMIDFLHKLLIPLVKGD